MRKWIECPECGHSLSTIVERDEATGEIKIKFFCEGPGDDVFELEILTGLKEEDLADLREVGKVVKKEMKVVLIAREPESYSEY